MKKEVGRFILPFVAISFYCLPCWAQTQTDLVISDKWEESNNVVVQQEINIETETAASPVDTDEVVVKFQAGVPQATIEKLINSLGTQIIKKNESLGFYRLRIISGETAAKVVEAFKKYTNVVYAEAVYYYRSRFVPNDELYPNQWSLDNPLMDGIHMQKAWDISRGSPNVIIAIVDTGVAYENYYDQKNYFYLAPDLAKTTFVAGYDFVNDDTHPNDDNWHGTLIAGIIAQSTNNGLGTAGIAPGCSIMPVKVLDSKGYGNTIDLAEGIIWAADHGARVINLSFGGPEPSSVIKDACAYAYSKGATLVCASGNRGLPRVLYPAAYDDYCIAVGASRFDETRAYYSDYGPSLDLVAPGGDTTLDQNRDGFGDGIMAMTFGPQGYNDWVYLSALGTSMAAAHVSAVAGLIISAGIATAPDKVREVLQKTAEDRGASGFDVEHGWGLVDAEAALKYKEGQDVSVDQNQAQTAGDQTVPAAQSTPTPEATSGSGILASGEDSSQTQSTQALSSDTPVITDTSNIINLRGNPMVISDGKYVYLNRQSFFDDCQCEYDARDIPISAAYNFADAVFVGQVVRAFPGNKKAKQEGQVILRDFFKINIIKNYKGAVGNPVKVRFLSAQACSPVGGAQDTISCGSIRSCGLGAILQKENTYLFYVKEVKGKGVLFDANVCSRIIPVAEAGDDFNILESIPR